MSDKQKKQHTRNVMKAEQGNNYSQNTLKRLKKKSLDTRRKFEENLARTETAKLLNVNNYKVDDFSDFNEIEADREWREECYEEIENYLKLKEREEIRSHVFTDERSRQNVENDIISSVRQNGKLYIEVEEVGDKDSGLLRMRSRQVYQELENKKPRGKIRHHSDRSCKRINDFVQEIDLDVLTELGKFRSTFITFTFGQNYPTPEEAYRYFDNFRKRLERYVLSQGYKLDYSAIWKKEPQKKRGAVHFHLLCFKLPPIGPEKISEMWGGVVPKKYWNVAEGNLKPPNTKIEYVRSNRGCACYTAKYMAKGESGYDHSGGDDRGDRTELSQPRCTVGLGSVPYLTAESYVDNKYLINDLIKRAILDGNAPPERGLSDGHKKKFREFIGFSIKNYATIEELDILAPPIGQVWGVWRKSNMVKMPVKKKVYIVTLAAFRRVKSFCAEIRDFKLNFDDKGFTFYLNARFEREMIHEILSYFNGMNFTGCEVSL